MNPTTTATTWALVGAGRTVHQAAADESKTLCGGVVTRLLVAGEPAKKGKVCAKCAKIAATLGAKAAEAPALEEVPAEESGAPEAPAAEGDPEADDAPAEVAEVEEVPQADDASAEWVQVTAYTAALDALHINGQDSDDRTLTLDASALLATVTAMRRMPRWNAAEQRFTINKVALIVARAAQGERVWVRGEVAPIRVDFTGAPIEEGAPAEAGAVDMAAVLAATRVLRRRKEVQRVIDNRNAARAMSTPTPTGGPVPAPVAEGPAVEESATYGTPQWRTLKGLDAPFQVYGTGSGKWFRPSGDRKQCTGDALDMVRTWVAAGTRYAEDAAGVTHNLGGTASRYWIATPAA